MQPLLLLHNAFTGWYVDIWGIEERHMPTDLLTLEEEVDPSFFG